jgi:hypothetical protein
MQLSRMIIILVHLHICNLYMQLSRVCAAEQVFYDLGSGTGKTVPLAPYNAYIYICNLVCRVCLQISCVQISLRVLHLRMYIFMPYTEVVLLAASHRPVLHFTL